MRLHFIFFVHREMSLRLCKYVMGYFPAYREVGQVDPEILFHAR